MQLDEKTAYFRSDEYKAEMERLMHAKELESQRAMELALGLTGYLEAAPAKAITRCVMHCGRASGGAHWTKIKQQISIRIFHAQNDYRLTERF